MAINISPDDSDFMDAVADTESAGGKYKIGPQTKYGRAMGKYQMLESTFNEWKQRPDADIMNDDDNTAAAKAYLKHLTKYYEGDTELALAAYNHGMGNVDKAVARAKNRGESGSFADIAAQKDFPDETRKYVPKILAGYDQKKKIAPGETDSEIADSDYGQVNLPPIKPHSGSGDLQTFKETLYPIMSSPDWNALSPVEQIKQLDKVVESGAWDSEVFPTIKKVSSLLWETVPLEQRPNFNELTQQVAGQYPILPKDTQEPEKALDTFNHEFKQILNSKGVLPEIFGDQLDAYLEKSKQAELEGYANRSRGKVAELALDTYAYASKGLTGAISGATAIVPAAARYNLGSLVNSDVRALGEEFALAAEAAPKKITTLYGYLSDPDRILAARDDAGRVITDDAGNPIPDSPRAQSIIDLAGNIAGMFVAGGASNRALESYGRLQQVATSLGMQTAVGMNMAYHETKAEGGTDEQAWRAGLYSIPGSALGAVATSFVNFGSAEKALGLSPAQAGMIDSSLKKLGVGAPPIIQGLSRTQQAVNLASWAAINLGAVEGPAMAGMQLWQSTAAGMALGKDVVTTDKLVNAYFAGVFGGAFGKLAQVGEARTKTAREVQDFKNFASRVEAEGAPSSGVAVPGEKPGIAVKPLSWREEVALGAKLEKFMQSDAAKINLTVQEAAHIPEFILKNTGLIPEAGVDNKSVNLSKRSTWVNKEAGTTIEELDASIKSNQAYLDNHPPAGSEENIVNNYTALNRDIAAQEKQYSGEYARVIQRRDQLNNDFVAAQKIYDEAVISKNPTQISEAKKLRSQIADELKIFDEANRNTYEGWDKLLKSRSKRDELKPWYDLIMTGRNERYPDERPYGVIQQDIKNASANLEFLLKKRSSLEAETAAKQRDAEQLNADRRTSEQDFLNRKRELLLKNRKLSHIPSNVDYSQGVLVDGKVVMPNNGKWYVMAQDGTFSNRAYDYYWDAVKSLELQGTDKVVAAIDKSFPELKGLSTDKKLAEFARYKNSVGKLRDILANKSKPELKPPSPFEEVKQVTQEEHNAKQLRKLYPGLSKKKLSVADTIAKAQDFLNRIDSVPELEREVKANVERQSGGRHYASTEPNALREGLATDQVTDIDAAASSVEASAKGVPFTAYQQSRRYYNGFQHPHEEAKWTPVINFEQKSDVQVKPNDIVKDIHGLAKFIAKDFTILYGGKLPKGYAGYIDHLHYLSKVGHYEDLRTLIHEVVGHLVDSRLISKWDNMNRPDYSSIPEALHPGVIDHSYQFYPKDLDNYPQQMKEGMAMFLQHHITGLPTRKDVRAWYDTQFKAAQPEVHAKIEAIRNKMFEYYNQKPELAAAGIMREPQSRFAKLLEKTNSEFLLDKLVDSKYSLRQLEQASGTLEAKRQELAEKNPSWDKSKVYNEALKETIQIHKISEVNAFRAQMLAHNFINGMVSDWWTGKEMPGAMNLDQVINSVGESKKDQLRTALVLRSALARALQGQHPRTNWDDAWVGLQNLMKDEHIATAVSKYDEWVSHMLDTAAESNPHTAWYIDRLRKQNLATLADTPLGNMFSRPDTGFWVPFQGEAHKSIKSFMKAKGSSMPIIDPAYSWESAVRGIFQNAAMHTDLYNLVKIWDQSGAHAIGEFVREVTGDHPAGLTEKLKSRLANTDEATQSAEQDTINSYLDPWLDSVEGSFNKAAKDQYKYFSVMDKNPKTGKPMLRFFEVNPRVYKAIRGGLPDWVNNPVLKWFWRTPAQILRPMATSFQVAFQMKQLVRDPITAWRWLETSGIGAQDAAKLGLHIMGSLREQALFRTGKDTSTWFGKFDRMGLTHMSAIGSERQLLQGSKGLLSGKLLEYYELSLDKLESATSGPELATRSAVATMVAKQLGIKDAKAPVSPLQAIEIAAAFQRGTTNFGRQGEFTRAINVGVPFFTARIAEITRLPQDFKRNPAKVAGIMLGGMALGWLHGLAYGDDKSYQETDIGSKMNTAWFKMPYGQSDKWFGIPLDSATAMGWGLGQSIANAQIKDPNLRPEMTELAKEYFGRNVSPLNTPWELAGPAGKEFIQQIKGPGGWDYYFNRPIVPTNLTYKQKELQYTEYTTELAKKVGALTGVSPIRIDHAIRSTMPAVSKYMSTGELATGVKPVVDQNLGFWAFVMGRSGTSSGVMDRSSRMFYDKILEARTNKAGETEDEMKVRTKLEKINQNVSYINQVLHATLNQQDRNALNEKKRDLLNLGLSIARGDKATVPGSKEKSQAMKLRKEQTKKEKIEARGLRNPEESAYALSGSSE